MEVYGIIMTIINEDIEKIKPYVHCVKTSTNFKELANILKIMYDNNKQIYNEYHLPTGDIYKLEFKEINPDHEMVVHEIFKLY